jgi:hypothetical protein
MCHEILAILLAGLHGSAIPAFAKNLIEMSLKTPLFLFLLFIATFKTVAGYSSCAESFSTFEAIAWDHLDAKLIPPERAPRVSVVVPVYREYVNGNLERLLESVARQQDVDFSRIEVVLVVNNRKVDQYLRPHVFVQNQAALRFLDRVKAGSDGSRSLRKAISAGMHVEVVDGSTEGMPKIIGAIRQSGAQTVIERFTTERDNHLLAMFDADTVMHPRYISYIQQSLGQNPESIGGVADMIFAVGHGASRFLYATNQSDRANFEIDDWDAAVANKVAVFGMPRIVVRLSSFIELGGFAAIDNNECHDLITRLDKFGKLLPLWLYPTITQDRARPDGYDAASRFRQAMGGTSESENISWVNAYFSHVYDRIDQNFILELIEQVHAQELRVLEKQLDEAFNNLSRDVTNLRENIDLIVKGKSQTRYRLHQDVTPTGYNISEPIYNRGRYDYLIHEPWFSDAVIEFSGTYSGSELYAALENHLGNKVRIESLKQNDPIWDQEFLRVVASFLRLGWQQKDSFPTLHQFLAANEAKNRALVASGINSTEHRQIMKRIVLLSNDAQAKILQDLRDALQALK